MFVAVSSEKWSVARINPVMVTFDVMLPLLRPDSIDARQRQGCIAHDLEAEKQPLA